MQTFTLLYLTTLSWCPLLDPHLTTHNPKYKRLIKMSARNRPFDPHGCDEEVTHWELSILQARCLAMVAYLYLHLWK